MGWFRISDDGVGMDPAWAQQGSGLQGIDDRVTALGGTSLVASRPGEGTLVHPLAAGGDEVGPGRDRGEVAVGVGVLDGVRERVESVVDRLILRVSEAGVSECAARRRARRRDPQPDPGARVVSEPRWACSGSLAVGGGVAAGPAAHTPTGSSAAARAPAGVARMTEFHLVLPSSSRSPQRRSTCTPSRRRGRALPARRPARGRSQRVDRPLSGANTWWTTSISEWCTSRVRGRSGRAPSLSLDAQALLCEPGS